MTLLNSLNYILLYEQETDVRKYILYKSQMYRRVCVYVCMCVNPFVRFKRIHLGILG